eukprot:scaffold24555_cov87-Skeletonema_dohrnii-CCMP3373.AAC.1
MKACGSKLPVRDLSPRFLPDCSSNAATTALCVLLSTANSVRFRSSHKSISPYNGASATYLASTKKATVSLSVRIFSYNAYLDYATSA